jgi:hypothetical protein
MPIFAFRAQSLLVVDAPSGETARFDLHGL